MVHGRTSKSTVVLALDVSAVCYGAYILAKTGQ